MASNMKSCLLLIFAFISLTVASLNPRATCHNDNCLRAVVGTRKGPGQASTASTDCSAFVQTTLTPSPTTITITTTTYEPSISTNGAHKRQLNSATIPAYASACTDSIQYSSACLCLGVTPAFTVLPTPTITSTLTVTVTSPPPSSTPCPGQTCASGFQTGCSPNQNCYCFTSSSGSGFCGQNEGCGEIGECATDADCPGGGLCALETCCTSTNADLPGFCLSPTCENGALKLMRMARMGKVDTAAYRSEV